MRNHYVAAAGGLRSRLLFTTLALLVLSVYQAFAQSIGGSTIVCAGSTQTYYIYSSSGGSCSASWTVYNGTITSYSIYAVTVQWNTTATNGQVRADYNCGSSYGNTVSYITIRQPPQVPRIDGFQGICRTSTTTPVKYSVAAVSGASTYTWSVGSGLQLHPGGGTSVTTADNFIWVVPTGIPGNTSTVTVTPNTGCGGTPFTRTITIEDTPIPTSNIRIYKQGFSTTDTYMCSSRTYTIRVDAPLARSRSNWTVSGNYTSYYIGTDFVDVTTTSNFQYLNVGVTVTNSCGQTTTLSQNFFAGYNCGSYLMAANEVNVFPNPATGDEVTVEWPDSALVSSVELVDWSGKVLDKIKPEKARVKLKLNKLTSGEYYIHVRTGEGVIRKRLQVKK